MKFRVRGSVMFKKLIARSMLAAAITAALFGAATQAQAEPGTVGAATQGTLTVRQVEAGTALAVSPAAPDDVSIQATFTFNRDQTERIYTFARTGATTALTALCLATAPGWLKVIGCPIFVAAVLAFVPSQPPAGRCLQVYTRLAIPPLGVRYVEC
jgi:hypothetical protein